MSLKTAYIEGKLLKQLPFVFNKVSDHISFWSFVASFYHGFVLNKTQFDAGFSERIKLKDDAV